ncbi:MAG: SpoVG family protein [Candidatus Omnitrophica bacterium]|nr:SpoVG family protein [Candidatus Omnitrophota bacterium]MBU1871412.1 SpoVG family protein [Candidatus Omnitrophota bacterium]
MAGKIEIEVVRLRRFDNGESKLKAFVDIAINGFVVRGLRIVQGKEGLYLAMPQEKGKDGRWYNSFYPKDKEARKALNELALAAYEQ